MRSDAVPTRRASDPSTWEGGKPAAELPEAVGKAPVAVLRGNSIAGTGGGRGVGSGMTGQPMSGMSGC
eukprot:12906013-Prorocentrum_lima.AAC.1